MKSVGLMTNEQSKRGSWLGRLGVNYVYGTSGVCGAVGDGFVTGRRIMAPGGAWTEAGRKRRKYVARSQAELGVEVTKGGQGQQHRLPDRGVCMDCWPGADRSDPRVGRAEE